MATLLTSKFRQLKACSLCPKSRPDIPTNMDVKKKEVLNKERWFNFSLASEN
jgi:hypothetical protein